MGKRIRGNLRRELEEYHKMGIKLYLNGKRSTPARIAHACYVAEEGNYMRDYIQDKEGNISGVSFDFVEKI